jgi:hypothetical protein
MRLKSDCLLEVEGLEIFEAVVRFKAAERLGGSVNARLAVPLCFSQIGEVLSLDPLVPGVVFCHGLRLLWKVTVYGGGETIAYTSLRLRNRDVQIPANLRQLGHAYSPVHYGFTLRTDPH